MGSTNGRSHQQRRSAMQRQLRTLIIVLTLVLAPSGASGTEASPGTLPNTAATTAKTAPSIIVPTHVAPNSAATFTSTQARTLDAQLNDAAQDLGMLIDLSEALTERDLEEHQLPHTAKQRGKMIVVPTLRILDPSNGQLELRLVAAVPTDRNLLVRVEQLTLDELPVRAMIMLRDIVAQTRAHPNTASAATTRLGRDRGGFAEPARSPGRTVLASNATVYGGFLGYSLQRASDSDDPRLLYPLLAVGAGLGLGSAIIIADEWDVGVGDAWYVAAGAWWPAIAGHLLYQGRFGNRPNANEAEAWRFGLIGSVSGLTLSGLGLLTGKMTDGAAAMVHSSGTIGMVMGGLTEFAVVGANDFIPHAGMGYGAAAGWLLSSTAALQLQPRASQILALDLGMLLGGLGSAAAASPLIFDAPNPNKTRGWIGATGGGLLLGGAVALYLARNPSPPDEPSKQARTDIPPTWIHQVNMPTPSVIGFTAPNTHRMPAVGLHWGGQWW